VSVAGRVYSTGIGRTCPGCGEAVAACRCRERGRAAAPDVGKVRVDLEKKGRRGKAVTVVRNLPLGELDLARAAAELKERCGTGGTVKNGAVELQGDRVAAVREWLASKRLA
jgi:translation initiation factor 1